MSWESVADCDCFAEALDSSETLHCESIGGGLAVFCFWRFASVDALQ